MPEFRPDMRALVQAGRAVLLPTAADRERVFAALSARLGMTLELAPPAAVATKTYASWQAFSMLGVGVGLAVAVAYSALGEKNDASLPVAPAHVTAPVARAVAATPASSLLQVTAPAPSAEAAPPSVASVNPRPSQRSGNSLNEEVSLLTRAETDLHAGRFANALALLDEHARTFPHGMLAEERIAARAQALCRLGRVSEGGRELARLAPGSLQASSAREACTPSESH